MRALAFWKSVTVDQTNLLEGLIELFTEHRIRYCVIGGLAVNAYAKPLVSLDMDLVVAADQIALVESLLGSRFRTERFPHSINVSQEGSGLRVQIQTDPRYFQFTERAIPRDVLGLVLPVASPEDVLQGKIWAAMDPERRTSKQKKDLLDIERLIEARPELRGRVPAEILSRL